MPGWTRSRALPHCLRVPTYRIDPWPPRPVIAVLVAVAILAASCAGADRGEGEGGETTRTSASPGSASAPVERVEVINEYPHDSAAFTQGLIFHDGRLYESTGLYGESSLREVELETGSVVRSVELEDDYFGEGLTLLDGRLYQLTWREETGLIYDVDDLEQTGSFDYDGEGWGLTTDGEALIHSDGSHRLRYLDPQTFGVERTIDVTDGGRPIDELNELEWVNGEVWANVWHTDRIARIDPETGRVNVWLDVSGLLPGEQRTDEEAVPNGIAYDAVGDRIFVTGKLWPTLFEIDVE